MGTDRALDEALLWLHGLFQIRHISSNSWAPNDPERSKGSDLSWYASYRQYRYMEMESIEDDEDTTLSRNTAFGHRFLLEKLTVEVPSWMKGTEETRYLGDNNQGASYNPDQVLPFEHAVMPFYTSRQALETTLMIGLLREREAN